MVEAFRVGGGDVLTDEEARVLGSLLEKEAATPEHYPLTVNALRSACNQTSSRNPIVSYDESQVSAALAALRGKGLVRIVYSPSNRAPKYRHIVDEALGLGGEGRAVICLLLLRGPQTVGELRTRSERLVALESLEGVEAVLEDLAGRPEPLAVRLARGAGQKESRYAQVLTGPPDPDWVPAPTRADPGPGAGLGARVAALEAELSVLRSEVESLRSTFEDLELGRPTT